MPAFTVVSNSKNTLSIVVETPTPWWLRIKALYAKSLLFRNISGPSIAAEYRKSVNSPSSMIVITDPLSHRVEALPVNLGGSPNGHNGVRSIISALGDELGFYRFRVGIGRDDTDAATYVLQRLSSHERRYWTEDGLDLFLTEIEKIAHKNG